jgi:hypothetical protein
MSFTRNIPKCAWLYIVIMLSVIILWVFMAFFILTKPTIWISIVAKCNTFVASIVILSENLGQVIEF